MSADGLDLAHQALIRAGMVAPPQNRTQRRARAGTGAGEGKHPIGATKPFRRERKARARRKGRG